MVVKDLSRFARNYSDAGSLIDNLFVQMGVRFISLADVYKRQAVERFHTLSEELRQTEAELEKTSGLMAATVDYAKTRPVFDGYKAARYSKKYLSEHEAELAAYRAARATMNELLDGAKLPKMADMKKSRQELAGKKKVLYAEYRKAQADMRQAVAVKVNISRYESHRYAFEIHQYTQVIHP